MGGLLRLDRLDAIESGLRSLLDVRNVRKIAKRWSEIEFEKSRLTALIKDRVDDRSRIAHELDVVLSMSQGAAAALDPDLKVELHRLEDARAAFAAADDERALAEATDRLRQFESIKRGLADPALDGSSTPPAVDERIAHEAFARWDGAYGSRYASLRRRVEGLLAGVVLDGDMARFCQEASEALLFRIEQDASRLAEAASASTRLTSAIDEATVARSRMDAIDEEVARLPGTAGGLAATLAELTSYLDGNTCPVCDRDFAEAADGHLIDHVHVKVRRLSAFAERLLALGRARTQAQSTADRLEREVATLERAGLNAEGLAAMERAMSDRRTALADVEAMVGFLREGAGLLSAEVNARRAANEARSRDAFLVASRKTISEFATILGVVPAGDDEDLASLVRRLDNHMREGVTRLESRLRNGQSGREGIERMSALLTRRDDVESVIAEHETSLRKTTEALDRAQRFREEGQAIRAAVDSVRSDIIRREFNDRLNQVWRDLFVRLAPGEPFIPAFRIPASGTQRIQPKLVTDYRDGGPVGGTPGAMLSAGNLNTAALTLFLALHLSVPVTLPWLILDDPVQSMDDVHIAHLAALLRTLSKEHGRQIIIAVHDRQLFDYLRLELNPAYPGDSLLTLELSRSPNRDTRCLSRRFGYEEEQTVLLAA